MSEPLKCYGPLTNGTAFMGMHEARSDSEGVLYYLASDVDAAMEELRKDILTPDEDAMLDERAADKALIARLVVSLRQAAQDFHVLAKHKAIHAAAQAAHERDAERLDAILDDVKEAGG